MNKSQMAKLAAAAGVNGLMYDPNAEGVFGNVQGYTVTIMPNANNRVYYMLSLSVSRMGMAPNPADFKPLERMNKVLSGCTVQRFRVNFLVKLSGNKDKMAEALRSALDTLITFLRTNGYTNCCEHCGRPEGVDAYTVSGNAYLLCEPCFGQVSEAAAQQNQTKMQKQEQVLPGIVGALIGSLIGAVVIVIVTFVLPQFSDLFSTMDSLPAVTLALMAFSDFMVTKWYLLLLGLAALAAALRALLRVPSVRLALDRCRLTMPVFGPLCRVICTARFARTISSLYASGLPIITALQTARDTIGNAYIASQFDAVLAQVRSGVSLSAALESVDGFQRKLCSSIAVGEETGQLDSMLDSIADSMEYDAQQASRRMMTILEPMLIVLMAFVVGFIIIAVMAPIIGSYSAIEGTGTV